MAGKRKTTARDPPAKRTRARSSEPLQDLTHGQSVRDRAEPYRLTTATFLVRGLTSEWADGCNREPNPKQVSTLGEIFEAQHLQRESVENRLRVLCSRADVEAMQAYLEQAGPPPAQKGGTSWPWFGEWAKVIGRRAELMAGQHRLAAMEAFFQKKGRLHASPDAEPLWWVCDVYDSDTLPPELDLLLRANWADPTLPDTCGQVWRQLVALDQRKPDVFEDAGLKTMMRIVSQDGRRAYTLWRNSPWREKITAWCRTALGCRLFNFSLWAELSRYRVEDYWFDVLKQVLQQLDKLCPGRPEAIRPADWKALKDLPSPSVSNVQQLFYPGAPPELLFQLLEDRTRGRPYRSTTFLTMVTDAEYEAAYSAVQASTEVETADLFPDIEAILNRGRKEGPLLSLMMSQVARWINAEPAAVTPRQPDKPPHWRDFIPAFQGIPYDDAEGAAQQLQRDIFDLVRGRWDELDRIGEDNVAERTYVTRFQSISIWHELLVLVHNTVGPRFVGQMERANKGLPPPPSSDSTPGLVRSVHDAICRLPQVSRNPALRNPTATKELMDFLSPLVARWAVDWCDRGLKAQADPCTAPWTASTLELVRADQLALSTFAQAHALAEGQPSSRHTTDGMPSRRTSPDSPLAPYLAVSSPPPPASPITSQPAAPSDPISGLLPSGVETAAAMRKAFRGLAQTSSTSRSGGAPSRPPVAPASRIRSWATTTTAPRAKLPWTSGPAARPYA